MKVLVTGSEGYIGRVLTKSLIEKGYQVIGFDTNYYAGCEFVEDERKFPKIDNDIRLVTRKT